MFAVSRWPTVPLRWPVRLQRIGGPEVFVAWELPYGNRVHCRPTRPKARTFPGEIFERKSVQEEPCL